MATRSRGAETSTRQNKIRFVMVEADLADGNLTELTQAITAALRPAPVTLVSRVAERQLPAGPAEPDAPADAAEGIDEAADNVEMSTLTSERSGPVRRGQPRQPKYIDAMDLSGNGVPFKAFAEEHAPKKHTRRYLVAAYWMKNHAKQETLNIDQMYTLYKHANWPVGIKDWDGNFRLLVKSAWMRRVSPGEYSITALGEGKLQTAE